MENDLQRLIIGGVSRHVLTGVAGFLFAHGAIAASQKEQFISIGCSVILWAAGVAWSWWNKQGQADVMARLKKR
jgi:high-affinity Fe2+/Pb2+ permease